jgi:hypothetical protein
MKTGAREPETSTTAMYYGLGDSRVKTGVVAMSSEEMRTELEIFVNQGLREGWRGWPRHDSRGSHRTMRTNGTNRTNRTIQSPVSSDRSYKSYPSYMSN